MKGSDMNWLISEPAQITIAIPVKHLKDDTKVRTSFGSINEATVKRVIKVHGDDSQKIVARKGTVILQFSTGSFSCVPGDKAVFITLTYNELDELLQDLHYFNSQ